MELKPEEKLAIIDDRMRQILIEIDKQELIKLETESIESLLDPDDYRQRAAQVDLDLKGLRLRLEALEGRAKVIRDFMEHEKSAVRAVRAP